jgi:CRISPR/Cas system-associated endoribonuclease Cas2
MGALEEGRRAELRHTKIQQAVLEVVYTAGVLSLALVAPNAVKLFAPLEKAKRRKSDPKYSANRTLYRLLDAGYLTLEEEDDHKYVRLTKKAEDFLVETRHRGWRLPEPKRWDSQWRVVIFDIPEKRKRTREKMRNTLNAIGFYRLQDSVWIYPYDCEEFITLLKTDFRIGKDLLYMIVARLENDSALRQHFGL